MSRRPRFTITFAPETLAHLDVIEGKHHQLIRRAIEEQLSFAPGHVTRNRKPMEQPGPYGATWELRFWPGNRFRVFYEFDASTRVVSVLAIGVKERNRLRIGREEFEP